MHIFFLSQWRSGASNKILNNYNHNLHSKSRIIYIQHRKTLFGDLNWFKEVFLPSLVACQWHFLYSQFLKSRKKKKWISYLCVLLHNKIEITKHELWLFDFNADWYHKDCENWLMATMPFRLMFIELIACLRSDVIQVSKNVGIIG